MKQKVIHHMYWNNNFSSFIRKNPSSKMHLALIYRYISLLLTSCFFLLGPPQSSFVFKLGLVVSLTVAAWILTDLQRRNRENKKRLKTIVLTETIGLTLLLIPTGGIASPFIWYALNPVLVAASFLTPSFCWWVLTFYLSSATFISYTLFNSNNMLPLLQESSYVYLVSLLTAVLVMLFSGLMKGMDLKATTLKNQQEELLLVNKKLSEANKMYADTLEHIMSLYHLMDNFSSNKSPEKLTTEITSSLIKCTQKESVFFWLIDLHQQKSYLENTTSILNMEDELKKEWHRISQNNQSFMDKIHNEYFWMKIIRTSKNVGVVGIKVSSFSEVRDTFLLNRTFEFIAELSEIMLERIHMDQMTDQLIIIEEQNRIANEIHDSVSQKLFGIVYSLHSLQIKSQSISKEELNREYQFLSKTANSTIKELRAAIYRLSSVKKGDKPFLVLVKNYLDEYAKLNDVKINYQITGDESFIPPKLKTELYRIICEACGNAVRHGECSTMEIRLSLLEEKTLLVILDNGIGFNLHNQEDKKDKGIGLFNMRSIVNSYNGSFVLDGKPGEGTKIQIDIPIGKMLKKQEVLSS
ncbi:sensor histidine kinase [Psychrobacillus sp. NPDC058041]|uniref:sensor histidine kinase n=1 Tax=Psychrobacillus sp. NPDC058041 TaxID=3346310 RepID=UPI0036D77CE8